MAQQARCSSVQATSMRVWGGAVAVERSQLQPVTGHPGDGFDRPDLPQGRDIPDPPNCGRYPLAYGVAARADCRFAVTPAKVTIRSP